MMDDIGDVSEMQSLVRKNANIITQIIEPTGFIEEDIMELKRVRELIQITLPMGEEECESLLCGLMSLFVSEWVAKSPTGKKVSSIVNGYLEKSGAVRSSCVRLKTIQKLIDTGIGVKK